MRRLRRAAGRPARRLVPARGGHRGGSVGDNDRRDRARRLAIQEAFVAEDALQCGFCTPGLIVSATALEANPEPTPADIRAALAGNIYSCGAYLKIERAILRASGPGAS